jgi:hypothetical protein
MPVELVRGGIALGDAKGCVGLVDEGIVDETWRTGGPQI